MCNAQRGEIPLGAATDVESFNCQAMRQDGAAKGNPAAMGLRLRDLSLISWQHENLQFVTMTAGNFQIPPPFMEKCPCVCALPFDC
jgi:hypothetical protein